MSDLCDSNKNDSAASPDVSYQETSNSESEDLRCSPKPKGTCRASLSGETEAGNNKEEDTNPYLLAQAKQEPRLLQAAWFTQTAGQSIYKFSK